MTDKSEAQQAILAGIIQAAGDLDRWNTAQQGAVLKDLAIAYRLVVGGQQPGGSIVTGK
jgi:hypothetical protein